jgi:hypothetical protein
VRSILALAGLTATGAVRVEVTWIVAPSWWAIQPVASAVKGTVCPFNVIELFIVPQKGVDCALSYGRPKLSFVREQRDGRAVPGVLPAIRVGVAESAAHAVALAVAVPGDLLVAVAAEILRTIRSIYYQIRAGSLTVALASLAASHKGYAHRFNRFTVSSASGTL